MLSASGDFGPAPEGTDLNETQVPSIYGSLITVSVCGTLAVALRFYTRISLGNPLGPDDWLILCGLIITWGTAITSFVAIPSGLGLHMWVLTLENFTHLWESLFAYVIIYVVAVSCTKLSIVFFYRRVFATAKLHWFLATMVLAYPITVIIVIFNACRPMNYFWTQYTETGSEGSCIKIPTFFFANGVWAACIDLGLLVVPIPLVWKLQMGLRQRLACLGVFMLGGFVVVASVVRIWYLHKNQKSADPLWGISPVYIWSSVEPFIGIICACLPTLSPLFKRFWTGRKTSAFNSSGNQSPYPNSRDLDTVGGSRNKHNRRAAKLRPDDEIMLTTNAGTQIGTIRDGSDENVSEVHHSIQVTKDFDVDWGSQKTVPVYERSRYS
ncbi:hypothetical protein Tdes44962_MAKER01548 [Teratosphaeria destructans]|uniref:Rhodopsin domain-containing protein n=1 Tax=Teratosphaeria destructans TaxID=418781 RepID=A0A9W7SYZ3_9PEZI|nr:hypothetical protein Tdes44962_MAKER01548 [Teratosphaeria destructans]